jgi:hypothetical protein
MTGIVAAGFRSAILLDLYLGYSLKLYRTSVYAIPESCGCVSGLGGVREVVW